MKQIIDIIQVLLNHPFGCVALSMCVILLAKIIRIGLGDSMVFVKYVLGRYFIKPNKTNGFSAVIMSFVFIVFSSEISDALQSYEQTEINPVFSFEAPEKETDETVKAFENEIKKQVGTIDFETVQKYCKMAADTLGCHITDIYSVALSECALNPYSIHKKGVAAGWTQLTAAGCKNLYLNGESVTLENVKYACQNKNIDYVMQTAFAYWVNRANGRKCSGMRDFYMLVFAPAFVGCSENAVLYEGANNPSYYMNNGFDGYITDNLGRIIRLNKYKDYRITAKEVELHVQKKVIQFLKTK